MIGQFRVCLERLNCQFEDFQCLALFAYFDDDNDGYVRKCLNTDHDDFNCC